MNDNGRFEIPKRFLIILILVVALFFLRDLFL